MPKEIERKFLVKSFEYRELGKKIYFQQGYIFIGTDKIVRVRTEGEKAVITIKSSTSGISRNEYEYEIPSKDALEILQHICIKPIIEKYRYHVEYEKFVWEVDEFMGENKGLIIAEIELESENQEFSIPEWIGHEVTGDPKFYNANLVKFPFDKWKP